MKSMFLGCLSILSMVACAPLVPKSPAVPNVIGLSYDTARQTILREGWSPRLSGASDADVSSGNGRIFWERGYTELQGASGTGLAPCRFEFTDTSRRVLVVITQGEEYEAGDYHAEVSGVFLG